LAEKARLNDTRNSGTVIKKAFRPKDERLRDHPREKLSTGRCVRYQFSVTGKPRRWLRPDIQVHHAVQEGISAGSTLKMLSVYGTFSLLKLKLQLTYLRHNVIFIEKILA